MQLQKIKDDTLYSLKIIYILSENVIFHEKKPQVATLPVEPFGTHSSSKFHHFGGGGVPVFSPKTD